MRGGFPLKEEKMDNSPLKEFLSEELKKFEQYLRDLDYADDNVGTRLHGAEMFVYLMCNS